MVIRCRVCKNELIGRSLYADLLAEIKSDTDYPTSTKDIGSRQIAHIECCSVRQITQILISQAQEQIRLYQDVAILIKSMYDSDNYDDIRLRERISEFETKYGSFDELRQGNTIDQNLLTSALISELKKKLNK